MAFSEQVRDRVRKRAHYRCCICEAWDVEVHHIIPQEEDGLDTEDNAAPLCGTCHNQFGGNPQKRKVIRETRDFWYEFCRSRLSFDPNRLDELECNIIDAFNTGLTKALPVKILRAIGGLAGPVKKQNTVGRQNVLPTSEIQVIKRVISALDDSNIELIKLTLEQLQDMMSDAQDPSAKTTLTKLDLTGIYHGETGFLKLEHDELGVVGRYQFDTEDYVGILEGEFTDCELLFHYRWGTGAHWGCGRLMASCSGYNLDGYCFNSVGLGHIDMPEIDRSPEPWSFTRIALT